MKVLTSVFLFFFLLGAGSAWANVKQIKAYKEAFADEKPKCAGCHVSEKPKKEAGEHEMNEYGKKVLAAKAAESPDVETYKQVGKIGE